VYKLFFLSRLHDVLHSDKKLTLVFEYCDQDLKKYFDSCNGEIDQDTVKVSEQRAITLPKIDRFRWNFTCIISLSIHTLL